jgi:hypothetical protein
MITSIGKACFTPTANRILTTLNNPNSNWGLWFQDLGSVVGRPIQEHERDKRSHAVDKGMGHAARETAIEESTTSVVWGGLIPVGKMLIDRIAPKLSKDLLMPNLDLRQFNKNNPQRLTPEVIETYFKHADPSLEKDAREKLMTMAANGGEAVERSAKALINKNRLFQLSKVGGVGLVASVVLGFVLPKSNQHITRWLLDKEAKEKAAKNQQSQPQQSTPASMAPWLKGTGAFSVPNQSPNPFMTANTGLAASAGPFNYQQPMMNKMNPAGPTPNFPVTNATAPKQDVRFGGGNLMGLIKDWSAAGLQKLQESDQMTTAFTSDIPLGLGRVATSRTGNEGVEKGTKEALIVGTLFVLQPKLNKMLAGQSRHIGFPVLKKLHDEMYGQQSKSATFLDAYRESRRQLGIQSGDKLSSYFEKAQNKPELIQEQIKHMREYFKPHPLDPKYASRNLLFDMAALDDKIPTIKTKERARHYIDITRQIDLDGVKSMAQYLDKLAENEGKNIQGVLTRTASRKLGAFAGSTMVCWSLMGYFFPKLQHYITYKRTGRDYFPGLAPTDADSPAHKPQPLLLTAH